MNVGIVVLRIISSGKCKIKILMRKVNVSFRIFSFVLRGKIEFLKKIIVNRICKLTQVSRSLDYRFIRGGGVVAHSNKRRRVGWKIEELDTVANGNIRRDVYGFDNENKMPTLNIIRD